MVQIKQVLILFLLLTGPIVIGTVADDRHTQSQTRAVAIDILLEEQPVGESVAVAGTVIVPPENYTAENGNLYQQFRISDETGEILIFCNAREGRTDINVGDRVRANGTFKDFYGTLEIYTKCISVERM